MTAGGTGELSVKGNNDIHTQSLCFAWTIPRVHVCKRAAFRDDCIDYLRDLTFKMGNELLPTCELTGHKAAFVNS